MSSEPLKPCTMNWYPPEFIELQKELVKAEGRKAILRTKIELLEEKIDRVKDENKKVALEKVLSELETRKPIIDEEARTAFWLVEKNMPWKDYVMCYANALNEVGVPSRCTNKAPASTRLCWQHCLNPKAYVDHTGVDYWKVRANANSRDAFLAEELKAVAKLMQGAPKKETVKAKVRREYIENRIRDVGCDPAKIADDLKFAEDNIKANQEWMQRNDANKSISEKEKKSDAKIARSNIVQNKRLKVAMEKQKKDCDKQKKG